MEMKVTKAEASAWKKEDLLALAKEYQCKGYSKLKKAELLDLLEKEGCFADGQEEKAIPAEGAAVSGEASEEMHWNVGDNFTEEGKEELKNLTLCLMEHAHIGQEQAILLSEKIVKCIEDGGCLADVREFFNEMEILLEDQEEKQAIVDQIMKLWFLVPVKNAAPLEWENDVVETQQVVSQKEWPKKKIYPNDPCPCGSGKKYKKCCGKRG
ncbi:MAG: SEC-C metal-binding domain-containing protein [Clostridiales bacterium]|nr:SEC-C metal-binding domain-containing protein [Clostridiales bacterium]